MAFSCSCFFGIEESSAAHHIFVCFFNGEHLRACIAGRCAVVVESLYAPEQAGIHGNLVGVGRIERIKLFADSRHLGVEFDLVEIEEYHAYFLKNRTAVVKSHNCVGESRCFRDC